MAAAHRFSASRQISFPFASMCCSNSSMTATMRLEDVIVTNGKISPLFGDYEQNRTTAYAQWRALLPLQCDDQLRFQFRHADVSDELHGSRTTICSMTTRLLPFWAPICRVSSSGKIHSGTSPGIRSGSTAHSIGWSGFYFANEHDGLHQDVVIEFPRNARRDRSI